MTDESTIQPDRQTTPPSKPGFGAPARHDFGDKTDRTNPRIDPTESEDRGADDAGEGHKGPLVDATMPGAKRDSSSTGKSEGKTARTGSGKLGS